LRSGSTAKRNDHLILTTQASATPGSTGKPCRASLLNIEDAQ
jgi:hypothetical protein